MLKTGYVEDLKYSVFLRHRHGQPGRAAYN